VRYKEAIVITNPAATTIYSGSVDMQENADREIIDRRGMLVDQGDGRGFLPTSIRDMSPEIERGHSGALTWENGDTATVIVAEVDRLDDSFTYVYDS